MWLKILSPDGMQYDGEAKSFNVMTKSGQITLLDGHRPIVTILAKGLAKAVDAGGEEKIFPHSAGFLEMAQNNALSVFIN